MFLKETPIRVKKIGGLMLPFLILLFITHIFRGIYKGKEGELIISFIFISKGN
jgi:hypothetical protein